MVNTKVIRQPSQSPSLLSSPLPLSPPPSFLSLLSLSSSHYPKFSSSLSFSFFPFSNPSSSTTCLPAQTRHPPHSFFLTLPTPILNSQFVVLSLRLSLFLHSLGRFSIAFAAAAASGGTPIGFDSPRLLASLEYLVGIVFFLIHVSISSGIGRTEL